MAQLTMKDGEKKMVEYNTAAKIYQLQKGATINVPAPELKELKALAAETVSIDFKKVL